MSKSHFAILCLICGGQAAMAEDTVRLEDTGTLPPEQSLLHETSDMVVLDYQSIDLADGSGFDLFGIHYLHRLNDWFFAGIGYSTPMIEGDYGGFFAADLTLHAQKKIFGDWFVDAGVALGAGAGGTNYLGIQELSGTGTYVKKYAGIGYDFGPVQVGVNYSDISIADSLIDDRTFTFFLQKPLSFKAGSYSDAGKRIAPPDTGLLGNETVVSFEFSNVTQIDPAGDYTGNIGMVSPQVSQFFDANNYYFFGLDLGYSGLIWYNQAQSGFGRRIKLTPRFNLYGQVGVGSGGWVTDAFDTGPGLVVYPKVKAEYMFSNSLGVSASAGYFWAPMGASKNWSLGLGVNYHLPSAAQAQTPENDQGGVGLSGVRVNLFERVLTNIEYDGGTLDDLYLATVQLDYKIDDHWYIPIQIAAATNDFRGTAGYVEGLAGIGWEFDPMFSDRVQAYTQVLYGMNDAGLDPGPLIYPSVGFNYNLSDRYSLYAQVGKTVSLGQYIDPDAYNVFENVSFGLGVSYRFSLPAWK
ncbi:MAG TPA: hypothetical protein DIU07_21170 [Rhodobacteraceae bacterium]|nr:hypothetical protein [Paracoccaceae bacterium]